MADSKPAAEPVLKEISSDEVAKHNKVNDCWMIIKDDGLRQVYDVTKFLDDHPGGPEIMLDLAGQDATNEFEDIGHSNDARAQLKQWRIGKLKGAVKEAKSTPTKKYPSSVKVESESGSGLTGIIIASVAIAAVALFFQYSH
jgi:cytochrome b5